MRTREVEFINKSFNAISEICLLKRVCSKEWVIHESDWCDSAVTIFYGAFIPIQKIGVSFLLKEINTFIQLGHIKLIKYDHKDMYYVSK